MSETLNPEGKDYAGWTKEEEVAVDFARPLSPGAEEKFRETIRQQNLTPERRSWAEKLPKFAKVAALAFGLRFLTADVPKAIASEEPAPAASTETVAQEEMTDAQKEILKMDADKIALQTQMIRVFTPSLVETVENEDGTTSEKINASVDSTKTLQELTENVASEKSAQEQISETAKVFEENLKNAGISDEITGEMTRKLFFDIQTISAKITPETTWGDAQNELFNLERMTRKGGEKIGLTAEQIPAVVAVENIALVDLTAINTRLQLGYIQATPEDETVESPEATPPSES